MKLNIPTNGTSITTTDSIVALSAIFPEYGSTALDIPSYDSEKHMYIVDQHAAPSGNRSIIYVAVGRHLVVEATIGLFHCWTYMNIVRLLIPDGKTLKVVKTFEWGKSTYYDVNELRHKITELATEYALDNIGIAGGKVTEEVNRFVGELVADLLSQDVESLLQDNGLEILKTYCRQTKVCKDFVTFAE